MDAWPLVLQEVPTATLVLAGPREDVHVDDSDTCRVLGEIGHHEVLDLLQQCRVAVLPSRVEAMPVFVLEAMAHGRPVVVTETGILEQLVGPAGRVFPAGNADELARALTLFLLDDAAAEKAGEAGSARVHERHAPALVAEHLAAAYDSAVRRRDHRRPRTVVTPG
jgi:glycosyltransferase involved in cell wall biosynthesis